MLEKYAFISKIPFMQNFIHAFMILMASSHIYVFCFLKLVHVPHIYIFYWPTPKSVEY
jgi:hypothetical protein